MADDLFSVRGLTREFRIGGSFSRKKMRAVDEVTFGLPSGRASILSVVGESGCGKTTLARMILRLLPPTAGSVYLNGRDLIDRRMVSEKDFCRMVQPIFQNPFDAFSTRREVAKYLMDTAFSYGGVKKKAEAREKVDKALKSVGMSLEVVEGKYSTQFSGGELQRVSIARALITSPRLIVADEPVAMIDASMKINIVNLFKKIRDEYNISFIYITHDLSTAYYVSDYIATLYRGSLIEFGPSKAIMEAPAHPYTWLLMNSVPHVGEKWKNDIVMSEAETREFTLTTCKFASRCPYATPECTSSSPPVKELGGGRSVLCFRPLSNPGKL